VFKILFPFLFFYLTLMYRQNFVDVGAVSAYTGRLPDFFI
jgi:hypothetical protein